MQATSFSYDELYGFSKAVFEQMGCNEEDATLATKVLLSADLRGVDSHGIARLSGYVRLWDAKRVNACPDIKVLHQTPSTATVDGDGGLGLVVGKCTKQQSLWYSCLPCYDGTGR
jgi:LDH2 family malate/lactate/ureidoglycolate dehydrogenase